MGIHKNTFFLFLASLFFVLNTSARSIKSNLLKISVINLPLGESTMPTWRQGMKVGEWKEIPNSAMSRAPIAVATPFLAFGPRSKIDAWCGLAIDTRDSSVYSMANGGHQDYAGNEIDRIRLSDNAPVWTETKASTPTNLLLPDVAYYADGKPNSVHSYYGEFFNEKRNSGMILSGAMYGKGLSKGGILDGFNLSTNEWENAGTFATAPSQDFGPFNAWAMVEHKGTNDIYVFANWNVLRWSNSTNTWSRLLLNTVAYGQFSATAVDLKRNRILITGGLNNDHGIYDINTNQYTSITFTGPNASAMSAEQGNGLVYDVNLDSYLLRKSWAGNTVYRINPTTFSVDILPTTGGASIPVVYGVGGDVNNPNGVWRRFLYVPALKGVVYVPTYDSNIFFLKTSE